jgi:hypothetical protein
MPLPAHPAVVVDLTGQQAKPVACIAMVRRALQQSGQTEAAERFTTEALSAGPAGALAVAARYVTLLPEAR